MRSRASKARGIALLIVFASFCFAFVAFSPSGRSQPAQESKRAAVPGALPSSAPTPESQPSARGVDANSGLPAILEPVRGSVGPALPTGKGLPVVVRTAVFFLEVRSFDDTKKEFECTTDVRMRWVDTSLRYPSREAPRGYREFIGKEAERRLHDIWSPNVEVANRIEAPSASARRLRVFPDGTVETITRTTARYRTHVDPSRFPFDRQLLTIDLVSREQTTDEVVMTYEANDVEFSRKAASLTLDDWNPGLVKLSRESVSGWNGERYSRVLAALEVDRDAKSGIAPIFIPLLASLLIPMLAVWMNKSDRETGFTVDAFELANIIIGGLFSVIALSFAIYTSYGVIAGGDNTVTRLFALNYASLSVSLLVVILFFRFNLPRRLFGPYVQEQLFVFISWAMPVLTICLGTAFLLLAAA